MPRGSLVLAVVAAAAMSVCAGTAAAAVPAHTDVMLVFDTSGSMQRALDEAKADIAAAESQISSVLPDLRLGVAQVRDYPSLYGTADERPWVLRQPLTADRGAVAAAISALSAGGGGDDPEAYGRGVWDTDVNGRVGWRPEARHLMVLLADSVPHDDDLDSGIPAGDWAVPAPFGTGVDPGRDGKVGTADDLDWQSVLAQLAAHGTPLEVVYYDGLPEYFPYWENWARRTGGRAEQAGSGTLADDLTQLATGGATAVLPPCPPGQVRDDVSRRCGPRTFAWAHGTVRAGLLRVTGRDGVPFDLGIDGSVTPSATLALGSRAAVSRDPRRIVSASGPSGQAASFSLPDGRWTPAAGASSSPAQLAVSLGWPGVPSTAKRWLRLFTVRSHIAYQRDFISARVDATIDASLRTSVGSMAGWVRTRGWLPPAARAASVAALLARSARTLTSAYGAVPSAGDLAPSVTAFLDHAVPLARTLGVRLPHADVTGIGAGAAAAGRRLMARIAEVPTGAARSKGLPSPSRPPGLRGAATVGRAKRHALSHGAWRRPVRSAARRLVGRLGFKTRVRPLWTSARRVRPGARVTVLAGGLVRHGQVAVTVAQGHVAREAALRTRRGVAGAVVQLPGVIGRGRAWLAISDFHAARHRGGPVTAAAAPIAVR